MKKDEECNHIKIYDEKMLTKHRMFSWKCPKCKVMHCSSGKTSIIYKTQDIERLLK